MMEDIQTTNAQKYESAKENPIVAYLLSRFFARVKSYWPAGVTSVLDAGCGEGYAIERLLEKMPEKVTGIDYSEDVIAISRRRLPQYNFQVESIYELPFGDGEFDLVTCLEVLEHLTNPGDALREIERVSSKWALLSVPFEPWFRLGNLVRGKHLPTLGNHPEHIQHWNRETFSDFLKRESNWKVVNMSTAGPWVITLCRK